MHLLFVDESGSLPPIARPQDTCFVLGSVVIPSGIWHQVKRDLDTVKRRYDVRGEIKWRFFSPGNQSRRNTLRHLDWDTKNALRHDVLGIIAKYKSIRVVCTYSRIPEAYTPPYVADEQTLYWLCYKALVERFQYHLQDKSREVGQTIRGLVVCDHRERSQDTRLRILHSRMIDQGGAHVSDYANLIETVFFVPSELSVGIQLADLVAGAAFRHLEKGDSQWFDRIRGSFRTSPQGHIDGYGLVRVPKCAKKDAEPGGRTP